MRKLVLLLVVLFLGFWMFQDPAGMARAAGSLGDTLTNGTSSLFSAVIDFIGSF